MAFVLAEGTVRVNIPDANLPQLPRQDFKVVNEMQSPSVIPSGIACKVARTEYQDRLAHLFERHFKVAYGRSPSGSKPELGPYFVTHAIRGNIVLLDIDVK